VVGLTGAVGSSALRTALGLGTADTPTFGGVKIGGTYGNILYGSGSNGYHAIWHPGSFWYLQRADSTPILSAGVDRFVIAHSTLNLGNSQDHGLSRVSAGLMEINNGTVGQRRDLRLRDITLAPSASLTPAANGDLMIEATSNTSITIKLKGSDGTVRSTVLTLS